ncbi:30S ribosomal protein S15, partial [Candidatus Nomurabacteria bacterium]|nr:30S ribosomal protein S15 [Candidatus Nomurabacteria bacterium]
GERRRLLRYLQRENPTSYENLVKELKLKQAKKFMQAQAQTDDVNEDDVDTNE